MASGKAADDAVAMLQKRKGANWKETLYKKSLNTEAARKNTTSRASEN
jgi:hypothetical protein